jgi:hypothetical protein
MQGRVRRAACILPQPFIFAAAAADYRPERVAAIT